MDPDPTVMDPNPTTTDPKAMYQDNSFVILEPCGSIHPKSDYWIISTGTILLGTKILLVISEYHS